MRKNPLEFGALALTAAVICGCVGYFFGADTRGEVYTVTVSQTAEEQTEEATAEEQTDEATTEEVVRTEDTAAEKININTATAQQLQSLNGIGEVKAQAIVDYRTENGPFEVVEDLLKVSGIGEGTLEKILDYITVE